MRKKRAFHLKQADKGSVMVLVLVVTVVFGIIGAAMSMMIQAEIKSQTASRDAEKAFLAAESGLEYYFYARSALPSDNCFPFSSDGTIPDGFDWEQAFQPGTMTKPANCGTTGPDRDLSDPDPDDYPCWPYDEALLSDLGHLGPNYKQHHTPWDPLGYWPSNDSGDKKFFTSNLKINDAATISNYGQNTQARFHLGFFSICSDDHEGDTIPANVTISCTTPPCNTQVLQFEVVSVGEVGRPNGPKVRRAVKMRFTGPFMYSGVIDKYVDLTLAIEMDINGPVHINGWFADGQYQAFYMTLDASFVPLLAAFDPPEVVSVSYPEDPNNPDWQPSLFGFSFNNINYVHLPVRIDIPSINWDKWEDRMKDLFDESLGYSQHLLKMKHYPGAPAGVNQYNYPADDETVDNPKKLFGLPLNLDCPNEHRNAGRIINCSRQGTYQDWNSDTFFDLYAWPGGGADEGSESMLGETFGSGPRNKSLPLMEEQLVPVEPSAWVSNPNCTPWTLEENRVCDETRTRPQFRFSGQHRFGNDASANMYVDGAITFGYRTPFHTCGPGDGDLTLYCVHIDQGDLWGGFNLWDEFDLFGLVTIPAVGFPPSPAFEFGVPHWHTGVARVEGEVLVNGYLELSDYVDVYGGTIYADGDIVKDETSALDINLEMDALLCGIFGAIFAAFGIPGIAGVCIKLFRGFYLIQDLFFGVIEYLVGLFGITFDLNSLLSFLGISLSGLDIWIPGLNMLIQSFLPWWPTIPLTNNGFLDFYTYLDIQGGNAAVPNSGVVYTDESFKYLQPRGSSSELLLQVISLLNQYFLGIDDGMCPAGSFGTFGICLKPAVDPLRIGRDAAIVAKKDIEFNNDQRMDVLTCETTGENPSGRTDCTQSTGYLFAGRKVQIPGDAGGYYSEIFGFIPSNSPDEDSSFNGIFYGLDRVTSRDCINPEAETAEYMQDILGNNACWFDSGMTAGSDWQIKGHIYAGKVSGIPWMQLELDQDPLVRNAALTLNYFEDAQLIKPVGWSEVMPPSFTELAPFDDVPF